MLTSRKMHVLEGNKDSIKEVAFRKEGNTWELMSINTDRSIKVWTIPSEIVEGI